MIEFKDVEIQRIVFPKSPTSTYGDRECGITVKKDDKIHGADIPAGVRELVLVGVIGSLHEHLFTYTGQATFDNTNPKYPKYRLVTIQPKLKPVQEKTIGWFMSTMLTQHSDMSPRPMSDTLCTLIVERLFQSGFVRQHKCRTPKGLLQWLNEEYARDNKRNAWASDLLRSEHIADILMYYVTPTLLPWFDMKELLKLTWQERIELHEFLSEDTVRYQHFFFHVTVPSLEHLSRRGHPTEIENLKTMTPLSTDAPTPSAEWFSWPVIRIRNLALMCASEVQIADTIRTLKLSHEALQAWWLYECICEDLQGSGSTCHVLQPASGFRLLFQDARRWYTSNHRKRKLCTYTLFLRVHEILFDRRSVQPPWSPEFHHRPLQALYTLGHVCMVENGVQEYFLILDMYWRNAARIVTALQRIKYNAYQCHKQRVSPPASADKERIQFARDPKDFMNPARKPEITFSDQQQRIIDHINQPLVSAPTILAPARAGCGKSTLLSAMDLRNEGIVLDVLPDGSTARTKQLAEQWTTVNTNQLCSYLGTVLQRPVYTVASTCDILLRSQRRLERLNFEANDEAGLHSERGFGDLIGPSSRIACLQRVFISGDSYQIPSIDPGDIFADLIRLEGAIPGRPCISFPLTKNFRQNSDASAHVAIMELGRRPPYVRITQDEAGYATEKKAPFMMGVYEGWRTYDYIRKRSEEVGWAHTQVLCFTHPLRKQTNRAMMYLCGLREKAPVLDNWGAKGDVDSGGKRSAAAAAAWKHIHVGQKIQFRNNYEVCKIELDEAASEQAGRTIYKPLQHDGPTVKLTKNRISIIAGICRVSDAGDPEWVEDTSKLNLGNRNLNGLLLFDCDDVQSTRYCVALTGALLAHHIRCGFCSTIDSSQGTQRKEVFIIAEPILRRRRLYTAVTRGAERVYVFFRPYKREYINSSASSSSSSSSSSTATDNNKKVVVYGPDDITNYEREVNVCFQESEPARITAFSQYITHCIRVERAAQKGTKRARGERPEREEPPPSYETAIAIVSEEGKEEEELELEL